MKTKQSIKNAWKAILKVAIVVDLSWGLSFATLSNFVHTICDTAGACSPVFVSSTASAWFTTFFVALAKGAGAMVVTAIFLGFAAMLRPRY